MADWSRIGRSSRRKGCDFERWVAKRLTQLLGEKTHKFHRTPMSGGHGIDGDIYEDPNFRTEWSNVNVYCRTWAGISWESILCDDISEIVRWIAETGFNSVWIFKTKPARTFLMVHKDRLLESESRLVMIGDYVIFNLEKIPLMALDLSKK